MASKFPSASHLLNDEVDYELKLRNYGEECGKNLESKQRTLRKLLHTDRAEDRDYRSMYSIDQEFDLISSRVNSIAASLAQAYDTKLISRLKHYHLRTQRSNAKTNEAKMMKDSLVKQISELIAAYKPKSPLIPVGGQEESSQDEEETRNRHLKKTVDGQGLDLQSAIETDSNNSHVNLAHKVQNLETQLNQMMSLLQQMLAKQEQSDQKQKQPEATEYVNRTGTIPKNSRSQGFLPIQTGSALGNGIANVNTGHNFRVPLV